MDGEVDGRIDAWMGGYINSHQLQGFYLSSFFHFCL